MDEYTYTVSVCVYGWHELCLIYVPRHGSLFGKVHAVVAPNQVVIRYDSVIDYSTMSDNTDSDEDVM